MPWITTEMRWFGQDASPKALLSALATAWPGATQELPRTDLYLNLDSEDLSIKIRGQAVETKGRLAQLGVRTVGARVSGEMERWAKWSALAPAVGFAPAGETKPDGAPRWRSVAKSRRTVMLPAGARELTVFAEVTELEVDGRRYWTVAVEASGASDSAASLVVSAASRLASCGAADALCAARPAAYPAWLRSLGL